jgi:hypothetical protein
MTISDYSWKYNAVTGQTVLWVLAEFSCNLPGYPTRREEEYEFNFEQVCAALVDERIADGHTMKNGQAVCIMDHVQGFNAYELPTVVWGTLTVSQREQVAQKCIEQ